jgi:hypothetical protein
VITVGFLLSESGIGAIGLEGGAVEVGGVVEMGRWVGRDEGTRCD